LAGTLKLLQEPDVVLVEKPDVVDAVADHGDAFDAEAEGPAGPDLWIVADFLEHGRVNHPAPGDLHPFLAHSAGERARKIDLQAWFGVAEVVRTETNLHVAAHNLPEDKFHSALKIADGDAFIHVKTFDLMERRIVRGIGVVAAIDASRHDDAHGRWLGLHHADLDR